MNLLSILLVLTSLTVVSPADHQHEDNININNKLSTQSTRTAEATALPVPPPPPPTPTIVWVTRTDAQGVPVATEPTIFSQIFIKHWTAVETPKIGSIGLGTISGQVGILRVYPTVVVTVKRSV